MQRSWEGDIPEAFSLGVLVIIPKDDKGGTRGIGLLEIIHKLISQIINMRMSKAITFCESVHGFRKKRGTYTAIGEAKLRTQMETCRSMPIYQIYLDLRKAYNSIDCKELLRILCKYKVGKRTINYIEKVWENQRFFLRQAGFYSQEVKVERGCTQ